MPDATDTDVKSEKPSAENIASAAASAGRKGPPPVHLWNPPFCGDLDMEIRRDGTWFYQGTPIGRPAMVQLFASILKFEDGRHFLVTPVEKVGIRVEDAPFIAVDAEIAPDRITFTTNVGDTVTAGPDDPIRVRVDADGTPRPYVHIRRDLWALIDRKTFYRLADAARPGPGGALGVMSKGAFFALDGAA
ncbi:DUF1285 domain-containing protein [Paracoccus pacificus]|uniref:DUF1285 domain-containing protein n=1 Tax=Paracoccus pacificus TaxID=1463598 RepID=A0ABW4R570_9RHOB